MLGHSLLGRDKDFRFLPFAIYHRVVQVRSNITFSNFFSYLNTSPTHYHALKLIDVFFFLIETYRPILCFFAENLQTYSYTYNYILNILISFFLLVLRYYCWFFVTNTQIWHSEKWIDRNIFMRWKCTKGKQIDSHHFIKKKKKEDRFPSKEKEKSIGTH